MTRALTWWRTAACIALAFSLAGCAGGRRVCTAGARRAGPRPLYAELQMYTLDPQTGAPAWVTYQRVLFHYPKSSKPETKGNK